MLNEVEEHIGITLKELLLEDVVVPRGYRLLSWNGSDTVQLLLSDSISKGL